MDLLFLLAPVALLVMGYAAGSMRERSHLRGLDAREAQFARILVTDMRQLPAHWKARSGMLVQGQAVIGSDYFKTFIAGIVNIFGGRVGAYESLMMRARREARLRMVEEAVSQGNNAVWNVRMETSTIGRAAGRTGLSMAEIHVYGTALLIEAKETRETGVTDPAEPG
ncbi:MAG: YbjQ family protein [Planctomycetota bacterium]